MDRIIAVIEHENPDLICLQEVDRHVRRSRNDDQPRMIVEHLKLESQLFQLNVPRERGGYGNLLVSRWPLRAHHQISLRLNQRRPRGAQIAIVDTPEGPLRLVNMHLGLAEHERHWQIEHLLGHHLFNEADTLPTMLIGDLNDWRNTLGRAALGRHDYHQATSPPSRFRSFPAWLAIGALDKAFIRGGVTVREARIVRTPLARRASDHLPLVIDFHLGEKTGNSDGA
jgi:endonuclease/exonuclease/phosphatase family metal-dependent hydrolase